MSQPRRALLAGSVGNFIEWYEFGVYGYFATIIAGTFFTPTGGSPSEGLIRTYASFAVAFFFRPVGSLLFGRLADRVGRRPTLIAVLLLMTGATTLIGLLPGYATLGPAAPWLLTAVRAVQGLSAGGEFGGAVSLLTESAPPGRRGLYGAWQSFTVALGLLAGAGLAALLATVLSPAALADWGWRLPFLLTLPLGLVALWLRLRLEETPAFRRAREPSGSVAVRGPRPAEAAPAETAPAETAPAETAVSETAVSETAPTETAVSETAPSAVADERTTRALAPPGAPGARRKRAAGPSPRPPSAPVEPVVMEPPLPAARQEPTLRPAVVIALAVGRVMGWSAAGYTFLVVLPSYLQATLDATFQQALIATTLANLGFALTILPAGALSDRVGRRTVMLTGALLVTVLAFPLLHVVQDPEAGTAARSLAVLLAGAAVGLMAGPGPAMLAEMFPTGVRCTGLGLAYALSNAVFSGSAGLIVTELTERTHEVDIPAYYAAGTCAVSVLALLTLRGDDHRRPLRD
ncbi:MFS transporter [Streptomyces sp. LX-29]|uniref:MFS transporter n=1 Tax=Streptomyces sp. LX-29 TaxID=2900152 RepID=UPI00240E04E0|nr:MFS transporter [Streptomyces sp. LX-29]WFB11154.1 MFS transporter [Streptomyces sp. LX-29]